MQYRLMEIGDEKTFHRLATDEHIRRYLLDGEIVDVAWCRAEIERSEQLHEQGVGLWLVELRGEPVGFIGYRVFEDLGPEPQLLYAFLERVTGRGLATQAARWLVDVARRQRWTRIVSAVDAPNAASIRVLEKVGFRRTGSLPGAFGETYLYELTLPRFT
ncbi:MAG: GNAT family N-acetyltransferase [Planctomycetota bacterium]